jgi:hypothetical protein
MSMRRYVLALLALAFSCLLPAAANAACPTDTGNTAGTDSAVIRDALKEICSNGITNTGSGAVSIVTGADATEGTIGDTDTQGTVVGFLKSIFNNTGGLSDESTSSGQKWSKVGCNATTAAPSYTTTKSDPISCDTAGNVRTTTPAVGATGSAVPSSGNYIAGKASGVLTGATLCDTHAFYDASDNGKKTVVAGVSAKKIYVCGFILATGGAATNLSLTSGTGSDCASTSTAITPAYQLIANDRVGANAAFWNGLVTLANADNLCVNASAGNAHQVEVFYTVQ